jgi:hypothetical protein
MKSPRSQSARHRTFKASDFLKSNNVTARREKANDPGAELAGRTPEVVHTLPQKSERDLELTCEEAAPQEALTPKEAS